MYVYIYNTYTYIYIYGARCLTFTFKFKIHRQMDVAGYTAQADACVSDSAGLVYVCLHRRVGAHLAAATYILCHLPIVGENIFLCESGTKGSKESDASPANLSSSPLRSSPLRLRVDLNSSTVCACVCVCVCVKSLSRARPLSLCTYIHAYIHIIYIAREQQERWQPTSRSSETSYISCKSASVKRRRR
jgi:hypothetical protein